MFLPACLTYYQYEGSDSVVASHLNFDRLSLVQDMLIPLAIPGHAPQHKH